MPVLQAPPNVTGLIANPQESEFYWMTGCATPVLVKDYPREVQWCRACHAATTKSACLALTADNEENASEWSAASSVAPLLPTCLPAARAQCTQLGAL